MDRLDTRPVRPPACNNNNASVQQQDKISLTRMPSLAASSSARIVVCVVITTCVTTSLLTQPLTVDAFQAEAPVQSRKRPISPSLLHMANGSPEENIDTKQISEPGDIYKYVDVEALEEEQRAKRRKNRLEEEAKRNKNRRDKKPKIQSSPPNQADTGGQVKIKASAAAEGDRPKMEPHPPDEAPSIFVPRPYDPENPEAIFENARMFVKSDLGLRSPNLLADDDTFVHITPKVDEIGLQNKKEYLAAGRFFDLRSTFPDLDYRAHDFRLVDELDEEGAIGSERQNNNTVSVRLTLRTTGTMTNELRLRRKTLPPTNAKMTCPPEAVTITFDKKTGKITKLCSGFVMDRLVGNTDGLCGVQAAATIAGDQPSDWEVFPPPLVLSIFGRPVQRLEEPKSLDAPFPEGVLISLAKGVIAADNGVKDQSVLDPSFSFCSPLVNPINKKDFLDVFEGFDLKEAFPDLQTKFTNFRVCSAKQTMVEDTADEKLKQGAAKKEIVRKKKRDATVKREEDIPKKGPAVVKKSATISLSSLFSFQSPSAAPTRSDAPPALESSKPKPLITAPRGIPTLSKYRRNRDGSITAYVFNSSSFEDGKMITTSPVNTKVSPGAIVETSSGSKYLLDPGKDKMLKEYQSKNKKNLRAKSKRSATIPQFKKKAPTIPKPSTETLFPGPKSRSTFSLFGLGGGQKTSQKQGKTSLRPATKQPNRFNKKSANVPADAPPGIPKVIDWKQNFDGSISGFVTGSNDFVEGERIVTSPLRKGEAVESESVVTTVSGSKYYLV